MKKIISLIMTTLILVSAFFMSATVNGATDKNFPTGTVSGSCGDLYWEIDDQGVFTIVGNGPMEDFDNYTAYWYLYDADIKKVVIGDGITRIGSYAFDNCYNITEVDFGNTVQSIGVEAFRDCSHINNIVFSDSIKNIEDYAFYNCSSIEHLRTTSPLTVGKYAFSRCNVLKHVYFPNSKSIGSYSFSRCPSLVDADFGKATLNSFVFGTRELSVKTVVAGSLKDKALYNLSCLRTANIINADYIGYRALYGCNNLTSVNSYAKTVGKEALLLCTSVKEIRFHQAVSIGDKAFYELHRMETAEFGKLQSVGNYAFAKCIRLSTITGVSNLRKVGSYAFAGDTALKKISTSSRLTTVGDCAFSNCKYMTGSFNFANVTSLGASAFANCQKLSATLNFTKVRTIGKQAFLGCKGVKGNTLGKSITKVGAYAFMGCSKVKSLYFPTGCKSIGKNVLVKKLKGVNINENGSVTNISYSTKGKKIAVCSNKGTKAQAYAKKNKAKFRLAVKSIKTNKNSYTVKRNRLITIKTTVNPKKAVNKAVAYTTSNKKVAIVNGNGTVKGIGKGRCSILIKSKDGSLKTKSVTVTVK